MTINVGVLGCGDVANQIYLPELKLMDRAGKFKLAAVSDLVESRLKNAQKLYEVPYAYSNLNDMLGDPTIDVVVNLTQVGYHYETTRAALQAGKHVYSEKPIALNLEEADRLVSLAREKGLRFAVAPALIIHPESLETRRLLEAGVIGKVCFIRARGSNPGPDRLVDYQTDPSWFFMKGSGPVIDLGIYPLQAICGFLGPAKRVFAFSGISIPERQAIAGSVKGKKIDVEVDDNTQIMLDFGEATFATLDATFCVLSSKGPRMEIFGTNGVINLSSPPDYPPVEIFYYDQSSELRGWMEPSPVYRGRLNPPTKPKAATVINWTLASGVEYLVECIEQDKDPVIGPERARHILEIILKAKESAESGFAVDLVTNF